VTEGDRPCPFFCNVSGFSLIAQGEGPCRAAQFLLPPLQIPDILAMHFPRDSTLTDLALPWHTRESRGGSAVTFEEILDQALAMLQRRGRVTYRTLQRQFNLDDAALEDLKEALLYAHPHVADDPGHGLLWRGKTTSIPPPVLAAPPPATRLATQDLHSAHAEPSPSGPRPPEAERRQLLAEVYGWLTEGFDTTDLQEAKALLEELA
jgi:hypothetical protein